MICDDLAQGKTKHQGQWVMAKGKWARTPTHAVAQSAVANIMLSNAFVCQVISCYVMFCYLMLWISMHSGTFLVRFSWGVDHLFQLLATCFF